MTALSRLLETYRAAAKTEREKGTYFEQLVARVYLRHEPSFKSLFREVQTYDEWAAGRDLPRKDTGIDLVATTHTGKVYAIQCKFYTPGNRLQRADINSFLADSSRKYFDHRILITTIDDWGANVEETLKDQRPRVITIRRANLEASAIDWSRWQPEQEEVPLRPKKTPRPHQQQAIADVLHGFRTHPRGKLLMACGTGKTFTSLKIAEEIAGAGGRVLFLVPSLALLQQTLTEWTQESATLLHSYAVCSDSDVGKKDKKKSIDDDTVQIRTHELGYPATTDAASLAKNFRCDAHHMSVIFSTYQSIEVISKAQKEHGLPDFDLIVCDEAHRTTGATFEGEDESAFQRVHDPDFIQAKKRLYMTATPRIYGDDAKAREKAGAVTLCSMDDEALYGPIFHTISFSQAVQQDLLCDYKVIVLAVDERHISHRLQQLLSSSEGLRVDDAAKIIGCWKALAKQGANGAGLTESDGAATDTDPMRRAVAFCQVIGTESGAAVGRGKTHKVSSKHIAHIFQEVVQAYQQSEVETGPAATLRCEAHHVDGSMKAGAKEAQLRWLRDDPPEGECRILSNVRCLSEGVDVPALDAVLFLTPRNSQIDVVQSVGRVMRKAEGKKYGYVVLPIVIPSALDPETALASNEPYRVVWQVLQALRSHDDKFDALINRVEFDGADPGKMEVIAITGDVRPRAQPLQAGAASGEFSIGKAERSREEPAGEQLTLGFEPGEIERAIYARLVRKVGRSTYWEDWARDIETIARAHITRIEGILANPANTKERATFAGLVQEMREDINSSVTEGEVVEMLAQHIITRPIFDALFSGYHFSRLNPMSRALQDVLDVLQEHHLDSEAQTLHGFYENIQRSIQDTRTTAGKQEIIRKLYDRFFRNAFPRMAERLGIVYTPVEVVDFILHSVAHLLHKEFGRTIGDKDVRILDPFTGTGTFIARLIQSGLIADAELKTKYLSGLYANEIVLLAYYIAAINIETAYHARAGGDYQQFLGISLADTFLMAQKAPAQPTLQGFTMDNTVRRHRQDKIPINVIIGNPPYSVGQGSQNDNNQNLEYPALDERIKETYAAHGKASLKRNLYDSYIRALRWASDRLDMAGNQEGGIIGFVTNAGWLDSNNADGLRKCLADEFSSIYIFHLRGDIRKNMLTKGRAKEGENIFGSGSMAGIAISFFVKNPQAAERGKIHYFDIGDDLSREEKLQKIATLASTAGIDALPEGEGWQHITPNVHGDWLRQRDDSFSAFIPLGDKKGDGARLFDNYSLGVVTNRDAWVINASRARVERNMRGMIDFYNSEVQRFDAAHRGMDAKARKAAVDSFIDTTPTRISWTRALKGELAKGRTFAFEPASLVPMLYRPFTKQWFYFNRSFNEMVLQMPLIFPAAEMKNTVIQVSGVGAPSFFTLITDVCPDHGFSTGIQCFPLYLYEPSTLTVLSSRRPDDTPANGGNFTRRDAITDAGLQHFQQAYPGETISKEDIFYYVYGLLHSPDYRERYADNLSKELPRIPCVKTASDFWAFSKAGRELAGWHLNYETVEPWDGLQIDITAGDITDSTYRVEKMKHPTKGKVKDKTTVIYNNRITIRNIPLKAWDYIVNGKPALDWVMERQRVKEDKDSGIVNDANDWATETMHDPRYPLDLFCRVVRVSMETLRIVEGLPKLDI